MSAIEYHLLLADDDTDDCMFFKEALEELPLAATLTTVNDGVELMQLLTTQPGDLPHVLFLDLNMPRKTGFECLSEIKQSKKLANLPVIIFSTSLDHKMVNELYENGAHYYIRKPGDFGDLKKLIHEALITLFSKDNTKPGKEQFVIEV